MHIPLTEVIEIAMPHDEVVPKIRFLLNSRKVEFTEEERTAGLTVRFECLDGIISVESGPFNATRIYVGHEKQYEAGGIAERLYIYLRKSQRTLLALADDLRMEEE